MHAPHWITTLCVFSCHVTMQVNLAVTLGKPIIPLQMEKMSWPPPGAMGPIFGEYIFVRFFQRPGEETKDERFWPDAKFTELLMQLRYTIAPDTSLITDGENCSGCQFRKLEATISATVHNETLGACIFRRIRSAFL
jgi:hypothetical protein